MTIEEATEIMNRYGYKVRRLDEVNYTTKPYIFREITRLSTANQFVEKLLLCMYNRQENDEKASRITVHRNFRGFNQADATTLSKLAEQFVETHTLTPVQYRLISSLLRKYHRQTFEIMRELGMIKVKGRLYYFDNEVYAQSQIDKKTTEAAIEMLDTVKEYDIESFTAAAIKRAEEDSGELDEEDIERAKTIASNIYSSGGTVQVAADIINQEI